MTYVIYENVVAYTFMTAYYLLPLVESMWTSTYVWGQIALPVSDTVKGLLMKQMGWNTYITSTVMLMTDIDILMCPRHI